MREGLFRAVFDDPVPDGPRLVLADWLTEQGDPRGEFIRLQCARGADERPKKRERELLKANARTWLGDIEPSVRKEGLEYRRGFVAGCRYECDDPDLEASPEWATVETLDVGPQEQWVRNSAHLLGQDHLRALVRVHGVTARVIERLGSAPRRWHTLGCEPSLAILARAKSTLAAFTELRALEVGEYSVDGDSADGVAWLLARASSARSWHRLRLRARPELWGEIHEVVDGSGIARLDLLCPAKRKPGNHFGWLGEFTRGPGGRLDVLRCTYGRKLGQHVYEPLARALQSLPTTALRELEVGPLAAARRRAQPRSMLNRAIARFALERRVHPW